MEIMPPLVAPLRKSSILILMPPEKMMSASAIVTKMGANPEKYSGLTHFRTGPIINPMMNRMSISGIWVLSNMDSEMNPMRMMRQKPVSEYRTSMAING